MVVLIGKRTIRLLMLTLLILGLVIGATYYSVSRAAKASPVEDWLRNGHIVKQIATNNKVLSLTFDDGPSSTYTPQILDILEKQGVKATFFVVGKRAETHPEIIKRMAKAGHELANHTYNHPLTQVKPDILVKELAMTKRIIFDLTGQNTNYFRPPGGKCTKATIEPALSNGYQVILWTASEDPKDWSNPGVEKIVSRVVDNVRNGSIIILHDYGGDRTQTIDALPIILKELQSQGYRFVTISQLLKEGKTIPAIEKFRMENWVE
ncbi:polysaccharide deacetylase family protein [Desulforamulus aquiferis]|uniref:Polysaccharide deacetylase family protein n=1 Tax=Desulforamulus aquiferis TaxID=1397668 RepID=A0AAW7ZFH5_9FIRM|nr:polysaccharide deacetylase family protein [Desulforamulus aquiferis]MDO7787919.1 polysaccharide deacetylase family protein [Desulforamulus aquiferis]RYD07155.1 hypothetical protein N752_00810 [Desulforamulus aquiferis]